MNKSLLITGATGTFGKSFIKNYESVYDKIIIFSRCEFKQFELRNDLIKSYGSDLVNKKFRFFIGDVRDKERLRLAFRDVTHVIHAAALKHVPACEYNPSEAIATNVNGTKNVCDVAIELGVKKVVYLSTDKAVEPINFYGSTKMLAEKYTIHSNFYARNGETKLNVVRYGNIIGSRGSFIETLKKLNNDLPVNITGEEMTRFWMHIDAAAKLVFDAISSTYAGVIYVPKLKAASVISIVKTLYPDKRINIVAPRQGEKIHEQLFHRYESLRAYENDKNYVIIPENENINTFFKVDESKLVKRKQYMSNDQDLQMTYDEILKIGDT